jgi:uncharacterized membrane protein
MTLWTLYVAIFGRPARAGSRTRLRVEQLEDRRVPSYYTITDLGTLPTYDVSLANGIDSEGDVVGYVGNTATPPTVKQAFLVPSGGIMSGLGTLSGGTNSEATGVETSTPPTVIGSSDRVVTGCATTLTHAFQYVSTIGMTDLGTLIDSGDHCDSKNSFATAINSLARSSAIRIGAVKVPTYIIPGSRLPAPPP